MASAYQFKDFFIYSIPAIASLAAGASSSPNIQIQSDSDFELQKLTFYCDSNAGLTYSTRLFPQLSMLITDAGSGRQLSNVALPFGAMMGDGELPFILPQTKIFVRNSQVNLQIANFSSATTYYNIYVLLIGRKLFN